MCWYSRILWNIWRSLIYDWPFEGCNKPPRARQTSPSCCRKTKCSICQKSHFVTNLQHRKASWDVPSFTRGCSIHAGGTLHWILMSQNQALSVMAKFNDQSRRLYSRKSVLEGQTTRFRFTDTQILWRCGILSSTSAFPTIISDESSLK